MHHVLGNLGAAIGHLEQGLTTVSSGAGPESSGSSSVSAAAQREEEARLRHRLGMALWQAREPERARGQLELAASALEAVRREAPRGAIAEKRLALFDMQTECYQALQRLLVALRREEDALVVAEKARNRALVDLLRERQHAAADGKSNGKAAGRLSDRAPSSVTEIVNLVNRQKSSVLYYSLAAGYLYSWLIIPTKGVVKFHKVKVNGEDEDGSSEEECSFGSSLLSERIRSVHESLGVTNAMENKNEDAAATNAEGGNDEDMWSSHLDALGDKLNQEGDRSGFLRMVNRSSRLNASSYSLSSLFSVGSVGCNSTISGVTAGSSKHHGGGSTRSKRRHNWMGPQAMRKLYELLLEPMEDDLPEGYPCELTLVLEGDLYLVPWAMLKSPHDTETLCEKYSVVVAPSLTAIKFARSKKSTTTSEENDKTLVVGNPKIPSSVCEQWGWSEIPHASQEASLVAEVLQAGPALIGESATKETVMSKLEKAECVHLACHVSWKLSALVLSPGGEIVDKSALTNTKRYSINSDTIHEEEDLRSELASSGGAADLDDTPSLSEFVLTAADILGLRLSAKLVVISSCHTRDETHGSVSSDGLVTLTRALLAAGAQCVLVSLWPVPSAAVKVVMRAFYSSLLQGARAGRALAEAMATVQSTKQLQHPANWAGFVLVGADVRLSNKEALLGQALKDMISTPDNCRDALRVTLHLVSNLIIKQFGAETIGTWTKKEIKAGSRK